MGDAATNRLSKNRCVAGLARTLLLGLVLTAFQGCVQTPEQPRDLPAPTADGLFRIDHSRYLAQPIVVDNLTVWPVVTDAYYEVGPYLTLAEAQEKGLAVVRERR